LCREGLPISASYELRYIISNSNRALKISNFSRRGPSRSGINLYTVMAVPAQNRIDRNNGAILANPRLVLALDLALSLVLLLGVAGTLGGAGT